MKSMTYIFGQPGCGKTSLIEALTIEQVMMPYSMNSVHLIDYIPADVTEIGVRRKTFSGTDALSMTAINDVIPWLRLAQDFILAEGDRLAVDRFFEAAKEHGEFQPVYLDTPDQLAADRREARGSDQSPTWLKGRITKARKLAERWDPIVLDGCKPLDTLVADLQRFTTVGGKFA